MERNAEYWQFDFHCNADSSARHAKGTCTFRRSAMPAEYGLKQSGPLQKQPIGDSYHSGPGFFLNGGTRKLEVRQQISRRFDGVGLFGSRAESVFTSVSLVNSLAADDNRSICSLAEPENCLDRSASSFTSRIDVRYTPRLFLRKTYTLVQIASRFLMEAGECRGDKNAKAEDT